jgi:hypothetical protein
VISLRLSWEVLYFQCIESSRLNRQVFASYFRAGPEWDWPSVQGAFGACHRIRLLGVRFLWSLTLAVVGGGRSSRMFQHSEMGHSERVPHQDGYFHWPIGYFNWPIVAFTLPATDGGSGA